MTAEPGSNMALRYWRVIVCPSKLVDSNPTSRVRNPTPDLLLTSLRQKDFLLVAIVYGYTNVERTEDYVRRTGNPRLVKVPFHEDLRR